MVKNPPACLSYEGSPKALLLDLLFFLLYFNDLSEYVESTVYLFAKDPVSYLAISLKDSCLQVHTDWMNWRSGSNTASCRRKELEAFINFVANFHSALQFTFIVSEIELPFLDITLRISGTRIQISVHYNDTTLTTSSIFLLSILRTANVLSLTASFSACVAFALAMLTSLCDQRRWFLSLLTVVILFPHLKMIYRE